MIDSQNENGFWTVTINRPEKANALSLETLRQLKEAFDTAAGDPDLCALTVTGSGSRVFCAGADLGEGDDLAALTTDPIWKDMSDRLASLPCLTIAALNGTCAGGGFAVALACDLRIATPQANFFYPVLKRGFLPQPADVRRMVTLIGPSRSKLILMGGAKPDAAQALSFGLIDKIVDLGDFDATILSLTTDARNAKPHHGAAIKHLFDPALDEAALKDCYSAVYRDDAGAITRIHR